MLARVAGPKLSNSDSPSPTSGTYFRRFHRLTTLIIHSLSFQAYNLPFSQILPTVAFILLRAGLTPRIPGLFTDTSEHIRF